MTEHTVTQITTVEELWETTGHGLIYVHVTGIDGKDRVVSVGGQPGQKLRITEYDRTRNQERVMDANADVFSNGMLIRKDTDEQPSDQILSHDAIEELFNLGAAEFKDRAYALNEYNVRRLKEIAEDLDATKSQIDTLDRIIATKWPLGGEMPSYTELKQLGEVASPSQ